MKTVYLSLLLLCISLSTFAQSGNKIAIHVEGGVKYDFKFNSDVYSDDEGFSGAQFFISGTYPLSKYLAGGIGTGVNIYTRYVPYFDGITSVPIFTNIIYKLPDFGDFIPFVDVKMGYGIVSRSYNATAAPGSNPNNDKDYHVKNSGGAYFSPSVGILFPMTNTAFSLSLSYDVQVMKAKLSDMSGMKISEQTKTHAKTLALRIGYLF